MARPTNMELRGRTWWVVKTISPSLRPIVGKRKLRQSLETGDVAVALERRAQVLADFEQELGRARKQASGDFDPAKERAEDWRQFAADAVDGTGRPASSVTHTALRAMEEYALRKQHGSETAKKFRALTEAQRHTKLDHYLVEYHGQVKFGAKRKADQRAALKRLMAWDRELGLETLTRKRVGEFVNEGLADRATAATKNKIIGCLRAYWSWMVVRGKLEDNPWKGQSLPKFGSGGDEEDEARERPFTETEVVALLTGGAEPYIQDCQLIAALSGMRREEICMLRVRDCEDGWFTIRKAKTPAGRRKVPIHSVLGTLVARRMEGKKPDDFLLHELGPEPRPDSLRGRGAGLTQKFQRYRESVGVTEDIEGKRRSLVNFHSWRRYFITKAETSGQPPWVIESVVGHKRAGMTLGTYSGGPSDEQRRACVEAVKLPTGARKDA